MTDVKLTQLLQKALKGDEDAKHRTCLATYTELHQLAGLVVGGGQNGSVTPTDLVHELYLKLFEMAGLKKAPSRAYFYKVALDQMRKLLVDHYRKQKTIKAGGRFKRTQLDQALDNVLYEFEKERGCTVEELEVALRGLRKSSERQYWVVVYRYYGEFSVTLTAKLLGVSTNTVDRDWKSARKWLAEHLS